jgi:hypothetical protein
LSAQSSELNSRRVDNPENESVKDSCLVAYLEKKDSLNFSLVFENVTQDTIMMRTVFEDFRGFMHGDSYMGFDARTYLNRESGFSPSSEPQILFHLSEADSIRVVVSWIYPRSKAKLNFSNNHFFYIPNKPKHEYGIQFFVRYYFLNARTNNVHRVEATTNYLTLIEPPK